MDYVFAKLTGGASVSLEGTIVFGVGRDRFKPRSVFNHIRSLH